MNQEELWQRMPVVKDKCLKVMDALRHLPTLEAEILWLFFEKGKSLKDIALILKIPNSTTSYWYRRAVQKLAYLELLCSIDIANMVNQLDFLSDREQKILIELFYTVNQDAVGRNNDCWQSSVRWIYLKTRKYIDKAEKEDPLKWFNFIGLLIFFEKNLLQRKRII